MSKTGKKILTAFILMACLAAGAVAVYYYISSADSDNTNEKTEPGTEVEKLLDKDLDTKYPEIPGSISEEKVISDETETKLKAAIEEFKKTFA